MSSPRFDRRQLLKAATAAGVTFTAPGYASAEARPALNTKTARNAIQAENALEGSRDWQLTRVRVNQGQYRTSLIEGYCSHQSIAAGDTLTVYVSADPPERYRLDVYRLGYYGGAGARHVAELGPFSASTQPTPQPANKRLCECRWEPGVEIKIPQDWLSGVYLGKLTTLPEGNNPYWQSYVIFIVRDQRPADLLFQCSDNTWQAYNRWPNNESLYTHPGGAHHPDVAVSFDRPYGKYCQIFDHPLSIGSGEFLLWEFPLCYWLEQHGYDVTYCSNSDVLDPQNVARSKCFLSVGHDEYWDLRQYQTIQQAIAAGVNVLWLSANSVYMVSPFSAAANGRANRVIERVGSYGPLREDELKAYAQHFGPLMAAAPDERDIIGARTIVPFNGGGDFVCTRPDHWIYAKTGMKQGEVVPGLIGWEFHGEPDLARAGLEVVAEGTAWSGGTRPGHWTATIFSGPKENFVFNAATIYWSQALASPPGHILPYSHFSRPHGPDARVQQITANLLHRAIGG